MPNSTHPLLAILDDVKRVCRPYRAHVSVRRSLGVVSTIEVSHDPMDADIEIALNDDDEIICRVNIGMWGLYSDELLDGTLSGLFSHPRR